ncbi:MAG: succinate--CoA ligase subunit alpha [Capsulimonadales bacterium]|nr:succinate--CoA ligase subunit alpha [Capsulimonadales bacterium]
MSILLDQTTKVVVSGITGREGSFHTGQMIAYGTQVVAGVTPGKGGQTSEHGVPIFDTVAEAVSATGANAQFISVPPRFAVDAILEGATAGVELIVCITEYIPVQEMVSAVRFLNTTGKTRLIGPNCPGLLSAGKGKVGIIPASIFTPGPVGLVSRSGTLTYEIVDSLTRAGLGQTTAVGIGGDPILGTRFIDVLPLFEADPETKAVVLVGEIGGSDEEIACEYIKTMSKPVVGFIGGRSAPPGKRMGHAGAIVSGTSGTAQSKVDALLAVGVPVADTTIEIPNLVKAALAGAGA